MTCSSQRHPGGFAFQNTHPSFPYARALSHWCFIPCIQNSQQASERFMGMDIKGCSPSGGGRFSPLYLFH